MQQVEGSYLVVGRWGRGWFSWPSPAQGKLTARSWVTDQVHTGGPAVTGTEGR